MQSGFLSKLDKILLPIAQKMSTQRHMAAIRDSFVLTMPVSLVGSIALLLANFRVNVINPNLPLEQDPFQKLMNGIFTPAWSTFLNDLFNISIGLIALIVTLGIAYKLTQQYHQISEEKYGSADPLIVAITALVTAFLVFPKVEVKDIGLVWKSDAFGATSIFTGMIVAIIVTEVYVRVNNTKLKIKLPDMVPPNIISAFEAIIPFGVCAILINGIQYIVVAFGFSGLQEMIFQFVQTPLQAVVGSVFGFPLIVFAGNLIFFFGIHQAALSPISAPIFTANQVMLLKQYSEGTDVWHMSAPAMQNIHSFIANIGGTGSTLGLIIAIFIVGRQSQQYKTMAKLTLVPGIFGINEPLIFGLPIVLNPILFIPFVFGPTITSGVYFALINAHIIPNIPITIPWTTPPFLNTFLASGGQIIAPIVQLLCLAFCTLLYIPFVKVAVEAERKEMLEREAEVKAA